MVDVENLRSAIEPGFTSREAALELFHGNPKTPRVRRKPCKDCAVIHGLYTGLAACGYKYLTPDERVELSDQWWCHEGGRCEGAAMVLLDNYEES